jgi:predicted GNAT family acetyltransferase
MGTVAPGITGARHEERSMTSEATGEPSPTIAVTNHRERLRYEITVDGELAGFAQYTDHAGVRTFVHTEVDDRFEGMGLGSTLVREALDDVRAHEKRIVTQCPSVRSYVERHPEFADLVA